jgi:hypothetical protein
MHKSGQSEIAMIEEHSSGEEAPPAKNSSKQEDSELELKPRQTEELQPRLAAFREQQDSGLRDTRAQLEDIAENLPGIVWQRILYSDGRVRHPYSAEKLISCSAISRIRHARLP